MASHSGFQLSLEMGYPFLDLTMGYATSSRFALDVGFRSLYAETYAPYAGMRIGLSQSRSRKVGIQLIGRLGYTFLRDTERFFAIDAGGAGAFGELGMGVTARGRRHGLFANLSLRLAGGKMEECDDWSGRGCYDKDLTRTGSSVLVTLSAELGWVMRITRHASYFMGLGVDLFPNGEVPAMIRFRNGVVLDL